MATTKDFNLEGNPFMDSVTNGSKMDIDNFHTTNKS